MTSPYLDKPLRSLEQAKRDAERRKFLDGYDANARELFSFLDGLNRQVRARTNKCEARHG